MLKKPMIYLSAGIWHIQYAGETLTFSDFTFVKNWFLFEEAVLTKELLSKDRMRGGYCIAKRKR